MNVANRMLLIAASAGTLCLLPGWAFAADALVGEWALTAEQCSQTRISYTADGSNEAFVNEDGQWKRLSSGTYQHQGGSLIVEANGQRDELHVIRLDNTTLTLSNADAARMKEIGVESVDFVRCPAR